MVQADHSTSWPERVWVDLKGYELTTVRVDYGTSWLRYEVTPKTFYGAWPIPHKVCEAKLDSLIT